MVIILIGVAGSGKTTIGKLLAKRIGWNFYDADDFHPESNLDKIFDPFFTTAPVGEGTGLGLSVCHSIVKQHKGAISVDNVEGKGTKVTVRLPVISDGS